MDRYLLSGILGSLLLTAPAGADEQVTYRNETLQGRIVFFADVLENRYGIGTMPDARERILAIETTDGALYPIVEDVRGRSFRLDERLREGKRELLVRRPEGVPAVQVIRIFDLQDDGRYEMDYWCEICAITMFELKPCDCCQQPIELRRRKID
jgi:hypothetical protein